MVSQAGSAGLERLPVCWVRGISGGSRGLQKARLKVDEAEVRAGPGWMGALLGGQEHGLPACRRVEALMWEGWGGRLGRKEIRRQSLKGGIRSFGAEGGDGPGA